MGAERRGAGLADGIAVAIGRSAAIVSRAFGHGGSSLPGMLAERVSPGVGGRLASSLDAVAFVTGTNGKTTTTHLLSQLLAAGGRPAITNRSGANLGQSITSTLLGVRGGGRTGGPRTAVLECDEFALPRLTARVPPDVIVMTNLFRDQLDRFGEIDEIERRWRTALERLPATTVVAPADDPRLAGIAHGMSDRQRLFGLAGPAPAELDIGLTSDSEACPSCGQPLDYEWRTIGHLGGYRCPHCGFSRPQPWLSVKVVASHGFDGQQLCFSQPSAAESVVIDFALPGVSNAYNAAAAVCAATAMGIPLAEALAALSAAGNAWGRYETFELDGRTVILTLGKNPASLGELVRIAAASPINAVMFVMNDGYQDGQDVSWYWDVNPAALVARARCAISGSRAKDFRLRLKYELDRPENATAELPPTYDEPIAALDALVRDSPPGGTIVTMATYTGLLRLREALVARGVLAPMPV
jgi:UDP-N-acetylmuramyl tripeptide synthase